jgi:hypothetical protein
MLQRIASRSCKKKKVRMQVERYDGINGINHINTAI